ncbi:hypothetical protein BS78_07G005900 [Paspalum vaginatum]|nr:hypothetical protein BS78_07G005900 [Paspalum vaginatum]
MAPAAATVLAKAVIADHANAANTGIQNMQQAIFANLHPKGSIFYQQFPYRLSNYSEDGMYNIQAMMETTNPMSHELAVQQRPRQQYYSDNVKTHVQDRNISTFIVAFLLILCSCAMTPSMFV